MASTRCDQHGYSAPLVRQGGQVEVVVERHVAGFAATDTLDTVTTSIDNSIKTTETWHAQSLEVQQVHRTSEEVGSTFPRGQRA
jgi:hypothetical protein